MRDSQETWKEIGWKHVDYRHLTQDRDQWWLW